MCYRHQSEFLSARTREIGRETNAFYSCWHQYQTLHTDPRSLRFVGRISEDGAQTLDGEGGELEHTVVL